MNPDHPDGFDYSLAKEEADDGKARDLEVTHKVGIFIKERIIARHNGRLPDAKTIAVRLIVFQLLIDPTDNRSLQTYAQELGCSRSWLSKVGIKFCDQLGMRASWQRINARDTYSVRAKGVHAGQWTPTDKWERRQIREAKAK